MDGGDDMNWHRSDNSNFEVARLAVGGRQAPAQDVVVVVWPVTCPWGRGRDEVRLGWAK